MTVTRSGSPDPLRALLALMAVQHGVASSAQARELGLDSHREQRAVRRGILDRPLAGVLVACGAADTWHQRACIASTAAPRCVLAHGAAARLHRLDGFHRWPTMDLLCPKGWRPPAAANTLVRFTRGLRDADATVVAGIRVLTVASTVALLAPVVGAEATASAVHSALRQGCPAGELREAANRWRTRGRPGPGALLEILDRSRAQA
jgi:hypothetical protein